MLGLEPETRGKPCSPEAGREDGTKESSNDDRGFKCIECMYRLSAGISNVPETWSAGSSRTDDKGLLLEDKPAKGGLGLAEESRDAPGMGIPVDDFVNPRP